MALAFSCAALLLAGAGAIPGRAQSTNGTADASQPG